MAVYNDYIVKKIVYKDCDFKCKVNLLKTASGADQDLFIKNFQTDLQKIKNLEKYLNDKIQKVSIKYLFLKVFYSGYSDYTKGVIKHFPNKKKFVELYLYAHGILLAKYFEEVKKHVNKNNIIHKEAVQMNS